MIDPYRVVPGNTFWDFALIGVRLRILPRGPQGDCIMSKAGSRQHRRVLYIRSQIRSLAETYIFAVLPIPFFLF